MSAGYTYILGSLSGTLYIGVTSDLYVRVLQHRRGAFESFSKDRACTRLLFFEQFTDISSAIAREKQLKGWRREKKLALIRTINPQFKDLAELWGSQMIGPQESIQAYDLRVRNQPFVRSSSP
jgi:putative endonuclease